MKSRKGYTLTNDLAAPGDIVELRPFEPSPKTNQQIVLVKSQDVEIIQLVLQAGSTIPTYEAEGEIILQCLAGRISLHLLGKPHALKAGQLLYLSHNEPFSIQGLEDASVLVTIIAPKQGPNVELIGGQRPR